MGWGQRKKEGMTRETFLHCKLFPLFCHVCCRRGDSGFFWELFSDSVLMRNHSTLPLKAACAVRRVCYPHLSLLPHVCLICQERLINFFQISCSHSFDEPAGFFPSGLPCFSLLWHQPVCLLQVRSAALAVFEESNATLSV